MILATTIKYTAGIHWSIETTCILQQELRITTNCQICHKTAHACFKQVGNLGLSSAFSCPHSPVFLQECAHYWMAEAQTIVNISTECCAAISRIEPRRRLIAGRHPEVNAVGKTKLRICLDHHISVWLLVHHFQVQIFCSSKRKVSRRGIDIWRAKGACLVTDSKARRCSSQSSFQSNTAVDCKG